MALVIGVYPAEDLNRIVDRGFVDVDLLETADERAILLEIVAIFFVSRRANATDYTPRQRRLQQVRGIHRSATCRAGADDRMDLIDEQDGAGLCLELGQHRLEPLLEIPAIARSRQQRAHVERVDRRAQQHLGNLTLNDTARQPLGNRRFPDAGLADVERIVLGPSAQYLNCTLDFGFAPDQRIDPTAFRLLVEIDAIRV